MAIAKEMFLGHIEKVYPDRLSMHGFVYDKNSCRRVLTLIVEGDPVTVRTPCAARS